MADESAPPGFAPLVVDVDKADAEAAKLAEDVVPVKSWDELTLKPEIRKALVEVGFVKPSLIQETALPLIITQRRNVIAQAKNGSGKTASFTLGLLSVVDASNPQTQAIVLSPTRELAKQNLDVIEKLGQFCGLTTQLVVPMAEGLPTGRGQAGPQIISGTPGKVQELLRKKIIDGKSVNMFILDEADVMISTENNMGIQVASIRTLLSPKVQVLLFSATYSDSVRTFAHQIVPNAAKIAVKTTELALDTIWQVHIDVGVEDQLKKFQILSDLYAIMNVGQSIIFVNSRNTAFDIAKKMKAEGHSVSLICGTSRGANGAEAVDPNMRDQVLDEFRSGVSKVLIATDVLARGIDVPAVTLVINYELPVNYGTGRRDPLDINYETYLHRIGRTGRFGAKGIAVNLVTPAEVPKIGAIEKFYNCHIEKVDADIDALETRLKEIADKNKDNRGSGII
jgi:ATP-dependent RNA helicase DDX19/DBP5